MNTNKPFAVLINSFHTIVESKINVESLKTMQEKKCGNCLSASKTPLARTHCLTITFPTISLKKTTVTIFCHNFIPLNMGLPMAWKREFDHIYTLQKLITTICP